jgi:hypothetical protein
MLTILGTSEKKCFICSTGERTVVVQFADRSFKGVLCLEHAYKKLVEQAEGKDGQ